MGDFASGNGAAIWLDGEMSRWKHAICALLANSLHYGGTVPEGLGTYSGQIFKNCVQAVHLFEGTEILGFRILHTRIGKAVTA